VCIVKEVVEDCNRVGNIDYFILVRLSSSMLMVLVFDLTISGKDLFYADWKSSMQRSADGIGYSFSIRFSVCLLSMLLSTSCLFAQQTNGEFRRGDCFVDGHIDLADAVHLIDFLFNSTGPLDCPDACDANDDGEHNVGDLVVIVNSITGFATLPDPGVICGFDPTDDTFFCDVPCDAPVDPVTSFDHSIAVNLENDQGTSVTMMVTMDTPDSLLAFSFGICHDSSQLNILTVTEALDMNQNPPDFSEVTVLSDGVTVAILMSALNALIFPAGNGLELFEIEYQADPLNPPTSSVCPCDTLGPTVPLPLQMVSQLGASIFPSTFCYDPIIIDPTFFTRGDCNGDGGFNVADAVYLLGYLFVSPTVLPCEDACDINDDGGLDISDPVNFLAHLFTGGAPPAVPNLISGCGADPTPGDSLGCDGGTCP
jgi:hypothetical protein